MECLDGPLNSVATLRPGFGPDTVGDPVANPGRFGFNVGVWRQAPEGKRASRTNWGTAGEG